MECYRRPNRSDVHLSMEEEAKLEEQTRDYFNGMAPQRHSKPQRSEFSNQYSDSVYFADHHNASIPEFQELQRLQANHSQKVIYKGKGEAGEEFVETEYYKDLNCIDKQHHTTGTGFIKMENSNGKCFSLASDNGNISTCHASCRGNPATNDWIPAAAAYDMVTFASDKPKRSDS